MVRNCVGGVSVGSTGHSPGLSNEGNTTLPHTNITQPSPIPGPIAHVNHTISNRYAVQPNIARGPTNHQNIQYSGEIMLWLMYCHVCLRDYQTTDISLDTTK